MLPASAAANLWRAIGQTDVTTNPSAFNLFTQNQYDANRTNGIAEGRADVTNNPAAYSLFTQSQYDTHHSNGVTEGMGIILSNAASYGLYDSNSIMDLNLGGVMVQKAGANAEVVLQLQTAEDLASGFTNNGPPITNSVPMNGNKGFMRIRALGNQ